MVETKKVLVIDCNACGVAGDMLLGAFLDLGVNVERIITAIKTLENPEFGYNHIDIAIDEVVRGEFRATQITVNSATAEKRHGNELIGIVEKAAAGIYMSQKAREFASKAIHTLIEAEAALHKTSFEDAHLHEVALVDTAAEIIGCAVALDDLNLFEAKIYSTPLAVGGGLVKFSHGTVAVPAPATLAILQSKNFPFHGGPIETELATPTGAAILVNLVNEVTNFYPAIVPLKVGFGAGTKEFPDMPAVLRVTVGNAVDTGVASDEIAVLETNVDDLSGEILGYTIDKLLAEGAKDVSITPMVTKKNRLGQIVKVIADQKDATHLSKVLIAETGTLGVRVNYCQRHIVNREVAMVDLTVMGNKASVRVKVSKNAQGEVIRVKPEFEDLKVLAEKTGKPLRELVELAVSKAQEMFPKK
ncbi:MAG: nickel pincer cofactor biosynthesis protein LarC [Candidatus Bathyarchaeota archaeon]|nr:nickel pincer cofactor biosynthesis protein LarC [Candidatus Bathyarchaeota archaeon]